MRGTLACLLFGMLLASSGGQDVPTRTERQLRACDDGGSGGVMIDGVCL